MRRQSSSIGIRLSAHYSTLLLFLLAVLVMQDRVISHSFGNYYHRTHIVHGEDNLDPPRPIIRVSDTIVGIYRSRSSSSSHYIDGSRGGEVHLSYPSQLAKLDGRTIGFVDWGAEMVRMYDIVSNVATSLAGKYGTWGSYQGSNPLGEACFEFPYGIAVTAHGKQVYISNGGHFVSRINVDKETIEIVAGKPGSQGKINGEEGPALGPYLSSPAFLSFDNDGYLLIPNQASIFKLVNDNQSDGSPENGRLVKLGIDVSSASGVTFHPHDGTAIISTSNYCLYQVNFTNPSAELTSIGSCGVGGFQDGAPNKAKFGNDLAVLWAPDGSVLFIADSWNNRIRYMPHDLSFVSTLAGTGIAGNNPGTGHFATLRDPFSLALVGNSLFFTQRDGHNIRNIELPTCPAGEGYNWKTSKCVPCAGGLFSDDGLFCRVCPPGKYTDILERTCVPCLAGTYSNETGQMECKPCPAGLASEEGAQECVEKCRIGTAHQGNKSEMCIPCSQGSFSNVVGSIECSLCPAGTATDKVGTTICDPCPAGSYQGIEGQIACIQCGVGHFQGRIGQSKCEVCDPGSYQDAEGQTTCRQCQEGSYQNSVGQSECILCPEGHVQNMRGQLKCDACTTGEYQNEKGQKHCRICEPGTYQDEDGQSICKLCSGGSYQDGYGTDRCVLCPIGTASPVEGADNSDVCQPCAAGHFSGSQGGATSCTICPAGTHQPYNQSADCMPCTSGTYSSELGSISCLPCHGENTFCSLGSSVPISRTLRTNSTYTTDPFFSTMTKRSSSKQDILQMIRIVVILAGVGIITVLAIILILVFVVLPRVVTRNNREHLPVRFDKWLSKLDVFSKKHWGPMQSAMVKRKTLLGGLCSAVFVVLVLTIVTLTVTEFFTINKFERMTILAESILTNDFSSSVDTRAPGDYIFSFTLHNVMDDQCALSSYSLSGLMFASQDTGADTDDGNSEIIHLETTKLAESSACTFQINCTNCFLSAFNPVVSLYMDNHFSMASSISYRVKMPHFYGENQLVVEQVIAPDDEHLVFKGDSPTHIPLSLTKTLHSRLSEDYFMFSLFSGALKLAPHWRNPTTIGYSVVHNPVELGSVANESNFHEQSGLSLRLSLQINPNALLIEEESKYSSLDLFSKIGALMSSISVIVVLLMNCLEQHCLHSPPRKSKPVAEKMKSLSLSRKKMYGGSSSKHGQVNFETGANNSHNVEEIVELKNLYMNKSELNELREIVRELNTRLEEQSAKLNANLESATRLLTGEN